MDTRYCAHEWRVDWRPDKGGQLGPVAVCQGCGSIGSAYLANIEIERLKSERDEARRWARRLLRALKRSAEELDEMTDYANWLYDNCEVMKEKCDKLERECFYARLKYGR